MWIYDFAFCCKFGKMSQIHAFRGAAQIVTILHRGVIKIYYNITWGGVLPIYYNITMGGVSRDPKFVLRNIWTAPNKYMWSDYIWSEWEGDMSRPTKKQTPRREIWRCKRACLPNHDVFHKMTMKVLDLIWPVVFFSPCHVYIIFGGL